MKKTRIFLLSSVLAVVATCSSCNECCTLYDGTKACKKDATSQEWALFKSLCDLDPDCNC